MAHSANEKIRISVVVIVAPRRADGWKQAAHARAGGDIGKGAVAVVVKQAIWNVAVEYASCIIGDEEIEKAVVVIVDPRRGKTRPPCSQARFGGDIRERSVAIVMKQGAVARVPAEAGHVEIDKTI